MTQNKNNSARTLCMLLCGVVLVSACTTTKAKEDDGMPQDRVVYSPPAEARDDVPALPKTAPVLTQPTPALSTKQAPVPADAKAQERFEITTAQRDAFLSFGPSFPLQQATVAPFRLKGRVVGYQIKRFASQNAMKAVSPGLRVGDVVTHLNGVSLIMPKDYHAAWTRLKSASTIRVDYIRNNQTGFTVWSVKP